MCKKLAILLCLVLGVVGLTAASGFARGIDIRIANGSDDAEQHLNAGMDVTSSDTELPYEDDGTPSASDEQVAGLRFLVPLAKGTKITKAYVEFTVDETKGGTRPVNLIIEGQLALNPPIFTTAANNITGRAPWTTAKVAWSVENWTTAGQKSQTPNLAPILQEIIDQAGWANGNALVLAFRDDKSKPSTGIRCADAYEDSSTTCALLHIEVFDPAASAPNPADGTVGVTMPLFNWTKGDGAIFHNVYFGTTADLTAANLVAPSQPFEMYFHVPGLEPGTKYYWRVDEVDATGKVTAGTVWSFTSEPIAAYAPKPADAAASIFPSQTLSWSPGKAAIKHQVYFSSTQADVVDGKPAADKGTGTDTKLNTGVLRASTTYYWRVDEITSDGKTNKGPVWSFTTADGVSKKIVWQKWLNISGTAVTNLTSIPQYPNNPTQVDLIDSFQSDVDWADNYGTRMYGWLVPAQSGDYTFWIAGDDEQQLWLSTDADPANGVRIANVPGWTPALDFDNTGGGSSNAAAQKSAAIKLQAGQKYFIMALGKEGGGGDSTAVAWQGPGIAARQVIPAAFVDTFALPPLTAFSPTPANGAADASQSGTLSWSAGDKAQKHNVYLGEDKAAVAAADNKSPLFKGQQANATLSAGDLEWNKTYYWRVDEIDAAGAVNAGAVWSFTTANFLSVDNMESYTDAEGNRIYETWVDGWTNGTGSVAGNTTAPFAERTIVHAGKQALPMDYNNTKTPFYSEVEQTFAPLQNWTGNGVTDLSLWFRGRPVAFLDKGGNAFTVSGGGTDIWNNDDQFRFAYKSLSGDGSITAKVDSLTRSDAWSKAGVMIRETTDGGSKHAMIVVTPDNSVSFQYRNATSGSSANTDQAGGLKAPYWVRLTRTGNVLKGESSADGKTWTQVGQTTITMTAGVKIGLAVTAHNAAAISAAEFSNVTSTGTGAWSVAAIGAAQAANSPGPLYVVVEDSAGKSAMAVNPNAGAVTLTTYTEWKIPLTSFTGVNLAKVKKLYVGVGDRKAPAAGGTGRIYIDDIRVTKP